jgi:TolB protein
METPYAIQHAELPAWSPDGENLVYRGASRDLRLLRFDRSGRVQPPVSISGDAFGLARTPVWSSDGNRLAVNALVPLSRSGEEVSGVDFLAHEVFVVDLSDNTMVDISESPFSVDYSPTWGGDAETVVFVSDRDGNPEIYLYNEQRLHRLTNNTVNDYNPLFAPDGRRIAYVSHRADVPQIYILELTDPPESYGPYGVSGRVSGAFFQWSADSTRLIFTALYRGGAQLYMLYLETGRLEPLTDKAHYAILMP